MCGCWWNILRQLLPTALNSNVHSQWLKPSDTYDECLSSFPSRPLLHYCMFCFHNDTRYSIFMHISPLSGVWKPLLYMSCTGTTSGLAPSNTYPLEYMYPVATMHSCVLHDYISIMCRVCPLLSNRYKFNMLLEKCVLHCYYCFRINIEFLCIHSTGCFPEWHTSGAQYFWALVIICRGRMHLLHDPTCSPVLLTHLQLATAVLW